MLEEISILRELDHPNIMRIYEYFMDDNKFYIISDLYQGGELYEYIKDCIEYKSADNIRGRVNEDVARKIIIQILRILVYLHSKGIVHRDIKPENLIFIEKGNVDKGL